MIKRSTWILVAVFVVILALAVYFPRSPWAQTGEEPTATPQPRLLADWTSERVHGIEITFNREEPYRLEFTADKRWHAVNADDLISQGKVEELLTSLMSLSVLRTLDPNTSLLATALDPGLYRITLNDAAGVKTTIVIGQVTATESGYYIQVDNGAPMIVTKHTIDSLLETLHPEALKASAEDVPQFTLPEDTPSVPLP